MKFSANEILKNDPVTAFHLGQVLKYLKPKRVILFGSKASGTSNERSDTDLAVETDFPFDTLDIIGAVDVVNMKTAPQAFLDQIKKEGIILYEG